MLAVLGMVALVRHPRLAFAGWLAAVCFVPVWLEVTIKVGFEPHVLASVGIALSLVIPLVGSRSGTRVAGRVSAGDGVFLAFLLGSLLPVVLGRLDASDVFVLVVQWTSAFLVGRLIGYRVPLRWVYGAIAIAFTVVAVLALVEFATDWNPFVHLRAANSLYQVWGSIQERGGRARAEGAFGHSIALGASLGMAMPVALAAPFRAGVRVSMVVVMMFAAVVTFSRTGLITGSIGVVLAVIFLSTGLSRRLRLAVTGGLVAVGLASLSLLSRVFSAAGTEATGSADYRLTLLHLIPDLVPFGYSSGSYRTVTGQLILANVPSADGIEHSIDNAFLVLGLTYGWVPLLGVLLGLLGGIVCVAARLVTAPTIALVAQIPALATVALITQYSTLVWFMAGLAVFSQSVLRADAEKSVTTGAEPPGHQRDPVASPLEVVGSA
jgi:hypothetical protein